MSTASFSIACAGPWYDFPVPKSGSKIVDFVKIFHSSISSTESYELIGRLHLARKYMVSQLVSTDASNAEKLHSVNDYIVYLVPFFNSMKNQGSVRLDAEMMFEWTGAFSAKRTSTSFPDIIFEVAMVLHTKSVLHHRLGRQMLYSDPTNNVAVAGQNFHEAAGIMDYLATILLPQWTNTAKRNMECNIQFCKGMGDIFTSEAQQMAVMKETQKVSGSVSSLMARLCVSVLRTTDEGMDHFDKVPREEYSFPMEYPLFTRTFFAALAYYYTGELSRLKGDEAGVALGYYRESLLRINDLATGSKEHNDKYQKLCLYFPYVREGVQHFISTVNSNKVIVERDNNMVFFQEVPSYRDLPSLPTGILVMPRKLYSPPINENIIVFTYDEKRISIPLGTLWTPPISDNPIHERVINDKSVVDTDLEFAIALQKKINAEEKG